MKTLRYSHVYVLNNLLKKKTTEMTVLTLSLIFFIKIDHYLVLYQSTLKKSLVQGRSGLGKKCSKCSESETISVALQFTFSIAVTGLKKKD